MTAAARGAARAVFGWMAAALLASPVLISPGRAGLGQSPSSASPAAPSPAPNPVPSPVRTPAAARFAVVLDAAHGGDDTGARLEGGAVEKTVTLALSVRLRSLLAARGFPVATTREANVHLDADARAQIANRAVAGAGGSACLSLHASEAGSGVHIFVSSLPAVAASRFLPWKTAQSAFVNRSLKLAGVVNSAFEHRSSAESPSNSSSSSSLSSSSSSSGDSTPIAATPARASLPGVDSMACPALAIEVAPVRGPDGKVTAEVTDPEYQTQIVEALAAALLEWKTDWSTGDFTDRLPGAGQSGSGLP